MRIYYIEHGTYYSVGVPDTVWYRTLKAVKAHLHKLGYICHKGLWENDDVRRWARIEWMDEAKE